MSPNRCVCVGLRLRPCVVHYRLELRRSTAVVTASRPCRRWCRNRCPSDMSRFIGQDLLSRHEDEPVY